MTRVQSIYLQFQALTPDEQAEFMVKFRELMASDDSSRPQPRAVPIGEDSDSDFTSEDLAIARRRMAEIESGAVQTISEDEFYRRINSRSEARQPT